MSGWGLKILGFRVYVRCSRKTRMGKKIGEHCESRRHKKLSDEASGDTENRKFALSKAGLLCCCTFYLTEFCDHLISWCLSRHQGGKTVITEFILANTMLFLKRVHSESFHTHCGVINKCKTGVCKFTFLLSGNSPVNKSL